ncbi:hypothetical protein EV424DRAFT_770737 [Suillus variegatus]|nr:hypothetical protein EV424DRAFT_770737 [Suillus variegatus]
MLQVAFNNSVSNPLSDTLRALDEESSHLAHTQDPGEIHLNGEQQVVITTIRAADLTLGLRRIPVGFHAVVKADGAEYQTSNQSVHLDQLSSNGTSAFFCRASHLLKFGSAYMPHLNWVPWSVTETSSAHSRSPLENYWIAAKGRIVSVVYCK